ncbi:hypothetical protein [Litoribaculum gwangyangense]|uniref:Aspartyl protease n=1 Tax=Litoribaculum gwangyangense TaxID=1130722 RepID=A0ABP9C8L3_9FLAO
MKKTTLYLIITLITNNLTYGQQHGCFDFTWEGATISGRYIPKAAMNISVTVDNMPHEFTMQLDLGAVTTELYGNSLQPYMDAYPTLKEKIDSTKTFMINNEEHIMFGDMTLKMGDLEFKNKDIGLFAGYGTPMTADSLKTKTSKHIGTIAPDLFQNKVLIIDYPNNKICLNEELPDEYRYLDFQDLILESGRIMLPFNINNRREMLMFDTGSSIFSLLTTKNNAEQISDGIITDSLSVNSWGTDISVYGSEITSEVKFGDESLPDTLVYFVDNPQFDAGFKQMGIWGITGNAYFSNNTIIIDYKNKKIAVK